jgi:acyl-CoA reductase-like NAD-dependent aldehyde dehydrogenase
MQIINPATEEVVKELREDTAQGLEKKFRLLRNSQQKWSQVPLTDRIKILQQFAALLTKNLETLAFVLTTEAGKPLQQSRNEINGASTRVKWLTGHAEKYLADEVMNRQEELEERISYEPLGVVCNISAWNYPFLVGVNVFVPALIAGNTVLYKPSEYATLTGLEIGKLLKHAGVPDDVFQVGIGGKSTGEALLELPFDGYFFTGSYRTGKYIYEKVARKMVPCQCELGGKDPLYVADDVVNVKAVAASTADGAFYNNGQSCCAVERIYVHEKIYDDYLAAFKQEVASWKIGPPTDADIYFGPLTRKEQIAILEGQIRDALAKGAQVAMGGKRLNQRGNYFEPTIITDANHDMQVMREESFGPVIGIMKVTNDEEAISLMKDTEYGLTASVYSRDQRRAERILQAMEAGTGYWNCCDRVSAALPWSGRKHSGIGATLSHQGLRAFVKPKAYHLKRP